jgi:hypothetical protein
VPLGLRVRTFCTRSRRLAPLAGAAVRVLARSRSLRAGPRSDDWSVEVAIPVGRDASQLPVSSLLVTRHPEPCAIAGDALSLRFGPVKLVLQGRALVCRQMSNGLPSAFQDFISALEPMNRRF